MSQWYGVSTKVLMWSLTAFEPVESPELRKSLILFQIRVTYEVHSKKSLYNGVRTQSYGDKLREMKLCILEETQMDIITIFKYLGGCHGDEGTTCSVWAPRGSDSLAIFFQNRILIV